MTRGFGCVRHGKIKCKRMACERRHTADEMQDAAFWFETHSRCGDPDIDQMLRQAANDEFELEKERQKAVDLSKDCAAYAKENAELRTAISDVKAICEEIAPYNWQNDPDGVQYDASLAERLFANRILRKLRGGK